MADPGLGLASAADEVVVVTKQPLLLSFFSRHDSPLLRLSFYFAHHAGGVDPGDRYHKRLLVVAVSPGDVRACLQYKRKNKRIVSLSWLISVLHHLLLLTPGYLLPALL